MEVRKEVDTRSSKHAASAGPHSLRSLAFLVSTQSPVRFPLVWPGDSPTGERSVEVLCADPPPFCQLETRCDG